MNVDAWKKSLESMKVSLTTSFHISTLSEEQIRFQKAWDMDRDVTFIGYRENEGRRRIQDIEELIDQALIEIDKSNYKDAAVLYSDTLQKVAMYKLWAGILESASITSSS
jgi:hypothetical protein